MSSPARKRWADSAARRLGPDRCLTVRYRDLVLSPERAMRRVSDFLRIDFVPSMISFHEDALDHIASFERGLGIHDKLTRRPMPGDVERWQRESRPWRVFLFEAVAGRALDQLGFSRHFARTSRCGGPLVRLACAPAACGVELLRRGFESLPPRLQAACRNNGFLRSVKRLACKF